MVWSFQWRRSWDEVWEPANLARWQAAAEAPEAASTPFMHPALVRGWLATLGGTEAFAPFFLEATDAGGRRLFWLLVRPRSGWRQGLQRRLLPVGDGTGGPHFAYNDPIVVPAATDDTPDAPGFWPAFERELRARAGDWFDSFALHRIRDRAFGADFGTPSPQGSPLVRLDAYPDFAAYMAARPNGLMKRIDRKRRKAASEGALEFHMHGPSEVAAVLAWLPDLEAAQSARYPETVLAAGLLENLASEGMPVGLVRASVLRFDKRPVSWRIDYRLNGTLYLGFCAIDGEAGRHSPGMLHAAACLDWHMGSGGTEYDLLIGEQAYKADWTDGETQSLRRIGIESAAASTRARQHASRGLGRLRRAAGLAGPTATG